MRLMRALLACLLSLAVVVQGHAFAGALDATCASHGHAHDAPTGHGLDGQHHGSHDQADAAADDPAPCSCLTGCHAVTSLPVSLPPQVRAVRFASPAPAWTAQAFRELSPPAHWRPPAAI